MSYKQNDRNEYCGAVSTIALISIIVLSIIINFIYEISTK